MEIKIILINLQMELIFQLISNLISLKLINYSFSKNKLKCELLDNKPYIKIHNFTLSENEEVEINFKVHQ